MQQSTMKGQEIDELLINSCLF